MIFYKSDLIKKEHWVVVLYITQFSLGILATCSSDNFIKLFNIKGNNYDNLLTFNYHIDKVYK